VKQIQKKKEDALMKFSLQLRLYGKEIRSLLSVAAEVMILFASLATIFVLTYQIGFEHSYERSVLLHHSHIYLLLVFFWSITLRYALHFREIIKAKLIYLDISIYLLLFAVLAYKVFFTKEMNETLPYLSFLSHSFFEYFLLIILTVNHLSRQVFMLLRSRFKPSLLFVTSFTLFILVGTGLLLLPNATFGKISFTDALFTSAASVCVTGLDTVGVANTFTLFGKTIILILIQIGGIGVMTFTSFFALSFVGNASVNSKMLLKDMLNADRASGLFHVLVNIICVTLLFEACGAYFIYEDIKGSFPGGTSDEIFFSIFHSVSAYCNAGISTEDGGLCSPLIAGNLNLHLCIGILVVLGGLGFPILFNYLKLLRHIVVNSVKVLLKLQKSYTHTPRIININSYIVMISTIALIVIGTVIYYLNESGNTLSGMSESSKWIESFFGAVTPRTAGFLPVDIHALSVPTLFFLLVFMTIGAAPMSTGGGLKVTTVYVAMLSALNAVRGKEKIEVRRREITSAARNKAFSTFTFYFIWIGIAIWLLSLTEKGADPFAIVFEVFSALSTSGFSLGLTSHLSAAGKCILIVTMLVGRIGIFTFIMSFCRTAAKKRYTYPQENILM
jgi:trk system potassium uptake protein TrkH